MPFEADDCVSQAHARDGETIQAENADCAARTPKTPDDSEEFVSAGTRPGTSISGGPDPRFGEQLWIPLRVCEYQWLDGRVEDDRLSGEGEEWTRPELRLTAGVRR